MCRRPIPCKGSVHGRPHAPRSAPHPAPARRTLPRGDLGARRDRRAPGPRGRRCPVPRGRSCGVPLRRRVRRAPRQEAERGRRRDGNAGDGAGRNRRPHQHVRRQDAVGHAPRRGAGGGHHLPAGGVPGGARRPPGALPRAPRAPRAKGPREDRAGRDAPRPLRARSPGARGLLRHEAVRQRGVRGADAGRSAGALLRVSPGAGHRGARARVPRCLRLRERRARRVGPRRAGALRDAPRGLAVRRIQQRGPRGGRAARRRGGARPCLFAPRRRRARDGPHPDPQPQDPPRIQPCSRGQLQPPRARRVRPLRAHRRPRRPRQDRAVPRDDPPRFRHDRPRARSPPGRGFRGEHGGPLHRSRRALPGLRHRVSPRAALPRDAPPRRGRSPRADEAGRHADQHGPRRARGHCRARGGAQDWAPRRGGARLLRRVRRRRQSPAI